MTVTTFVFVLVGVVVVPLLLILFGKFLERRFGYKAINPKQ